MSYLSKDRVHTPEQALAYVTECTLATLESYPKSGSKYEFGRQLSIAQTSMDWIRQMKIDVSGSSRVKEVVEKFNGNVSEWGLSHGVHSSLPELVAKAVKK